MDMNFLLGMEVNDKFTGFEGTVTAYTKYLTNGDIVFVQPKCSENNKYPEGIWLDIERLNWVGKA